MPGRTIGYMKKYFVFAFTPLPVDIPSLGIAVKRRILKLFRQAVPGGYTSLISIPLTSSDHLGIVTSLFK